VFISRPFEVGHGHGGMNMPGMVMVDTQEWERPRTASFYDVGRDDGRHDGPVRDTDDPRFSHRESESSNANRPLAPTGIFLLGYLAVWTAYSAVATLAQWGLHQATLLSTTMAATSAALNGGLLSRPECFS